MIRWKCLVFSNWYCRWAKTRRQRPQAQLMADDFPIAGYAPGDGTMRFRFCPKAAKTYEFAISSNVSGTRWPDRRDQVGRSRPGDRLQSFTGPSSLVDRQSSS